MIESAIERRLVREVTRRGGLCYKWVSPGISGVPDRIIITPEGRTIYVELKTLQGVLSARQKYVHAELRRRGADVRVLKGLQQVLDFVDEVIPCYSNRINIKNTASSG